MGNNSGVSIEGLGTCENHQWYRKFRTECPSGQLTFCEFKQLFGLKNLSEASKAYIMSMFEMLDMNDVRLLLSRSLMFIVYTVPIERLHRPWISSHFIVTKVYQGLKGKLVVVPGKGDWNEQAGVGRMGGGYVSRYSSPRPAWDSAFPWSPGHVERKWPGELSLEEFMEGIQNDEKLLETLTESLDLIHHQQDPGRDEPLLLQHKKIL
ncbi:guanylyl cyclase-activating protein 1-like [Salvelinus sp. IW2-2015]|uniref:guanylyl cyclase-activating protein 1-like n=1 Tax=Salvelinus sp. IW2-2015 TaxID=2691554 RepID=UPI0038D42EA8